jgi:polysaccharide deacetylase 2 family uncharacterized protein YibQ
MRRSPTTARKKTTRTKAKASKATQSRKRSSRRAKRPVWSRLFLILLCLVLGFLIGRWTYRPPTRIPESSLSPKTDLVDLALRSQFYKLGLSEGDIVSRRSEVQKQGDREWTQTTTTVQLPKAIPYRRLAGTLNREVTSLGEDFSVFKKRGGGGIFEFQVRVQGVVAHNIIFHEPKLVLPKIPRVPEPRARVAIVIDDLGDDKNIAMGFLRLDVPLSFSVFPFGRYSKDIAVEAGKKGKEVLLHLPMEPKDYPIQDPGKGRLLTTMGKGRLLAQLDEDLSAVPHIKGVNNHMGSKFTENPELMRYVLEVIQERGLFFLDSRTTPRTVGLRIARELGVKTGQRHVFLDNERDISKIKVKISELVELSLKNGGAVGIGHPYPETKRAIREALPSLRERGVQLVPVSALME